MLLNMMDAASQPHVECHQHQTKVLVHHDKLSVLYHLMMCLYIIGHLFSIVVLWDGNSYLFHVNF